MDLRISASFKYSIIHSDKNFEEVINEAQLKIFNEKIPDNRTLEHLAKHIISTGSSVNANGKCVINAKKCMDILKASYAEDRRQIRDVIARAIKEHGVGITSGNYQIPQQFFAMAGNLPKLEQAKVQFILALRDGKLDDLPETVIYKLIKSDSLDEDSCGFGGIIINYLTNKLFSKTGYQKAAKILNTLLGESVRNVKISYYLGSMAADVSPSSWWRGVAYKKMLRCVYDQPQHLKHIFGREIDWNEAKFVLGEMINVSLPKGVALHKTLKPLVQDNYLKTDLQKWIKDHRTEEQNEICSDTESEQEILTDERDERIYNNYQKDMKFITDFIDQNPFYQQNISTMNTEIEISEYKD